MRKRRRQARTGVAPKARARATLRDRFDASRAELEELTLTRVYSISDPAGLDAAYLEGLRASVAVALDYALLTLQGGDDVPPPPPLLLAQARLAARNGVGLSTVLRRYFAGYAVVGDFLVREARAAGASLGVDPTEILNGPAGALDRLIATVSEEYEREIESQPGSSLAQRQIERVRKLLAGEPVSMSDLPYDFEAHHLGLVASGDASAAFRDFAAALDARLLLVRPHESELWAWIGTRRRLHGSELDGLSLTAGASVSVAMGEPGEGLAGWRLTHRQAAAALPVALRSSTSYARYAEVALLAAGLADDLLATSLREQYLKPLESERDGGEVARRTLRAYLAADCNVSSAAAALGVNRSTVSSRLRTAEQRLGRPIGANRAALEVALALGGLVSRDPATPHPAGK